MQFACDWQLRNTAPTPSHHGIHQRDNDFLAARSNLAEKEHNSLII